MFNQHQRARRRAAEDDTDTETNLVLSTPPPPLSLIDSLLHAGSIQKVREQQKSYSQKYKDRVEAYDSERLFLRFGFHRISCFERERMTVTHPASSSAKTESRTTQVRVLSPSEWKGRQTLECFGVGGSRSAPTTRAEVHENNG